MSGAVVSYLATMFNRLVSRPTSAIARTVYGAMLDMKAYRPSGEDRSLLADVTYHFAMYDEFGTPRWNNEIHGTVVTEGLNKLLDCTFVTGSGTPAWFAFLLDGSGGPIVIDPGDTLTGSHAGWVEDTDYTGNRPAITFGAISGGSVDNSASQAQFVFTGTGSIAGAGVASSTTKGANGLLYDVGLFPDGYRNYGVGWNLYLSVTCSVAAA
jgi:hypothetical protein